MLDTPQLLLQLLSLLLRSTELLLRLLPQLPQGGLVLRLQAAPHRFLPPGGTSPLIKSVSCDSFSALPISVGPDLLRQEPLRLLLVLGGSLSQVLLGLQLHRAERLSQNLFLPLGLGNQVLAFGTQTPHFN